MAIKPTLRSAHVLKQEAEVVGYEVQEVLEVKEQQKLDREERAEWRKIRMAELQAVAKEKKRADEILFAQIEAAKEQAKIEAEKELKIKEMELQAQQAQPQATTSHAATPPPLNKDAKSPKPSSFTDEKDELTATCYAENASWEKDM